MEIFRVYVHTHSLRRFVLCVRGRRRRLCVELKAGARLLMSFYFMLTIKRARAPLKRLIARLSEKSSLCIIGSRKIPRLHH